MKAFEALTSKVVPLDRPNVDTDAIIPKQYLKSIERTGFGQYLFDDWRYLDPGDLETPVTQRRLNPEFVLNNAAHQGAKILLGRENFGCGSSREHAVWALDDYGFRVVLASSFADIFYSNSFKNGLLPIALSEQVIQTLFEAVAQRAEQLITVDLEQQTVSITDGPSWNFEIDAFRKDCLLRGLDEIGLTLQRRDAIKAFEVRRAQTHPWL